MLCVSLQQQRVRLPGVRQVLPRHVFCVPCVGMHASTVLYPVGRGQHSHAYTHSVQVNSVTLLVVELRSLPPLLQVGHHVFLNLETLEFYCLPDNYQIIDPSLEDIKVVH